LNINTNIFYENFEEKEVPFIRKVELKTSLPNNIQICGDKLEIIITLQSPKSIKNACFSIQITDSKDRNYIHSWIFDTDTSFCRTPGIQKLICVIPSLKLYMGHYTIKCHFTEPPGGEVFERLENICPFEVVMYGSDRSNFNWQPDACAYIEKSTWQVEKNTYETEKLFKKSV